MNASYFLGLFCFVGSAIGAALAFYTTKDGATTGVLMLGALVLFPSGIIIYAASAPAQFLRIFRDRGTALEQARNAPMGGFIWPWLIYGMAHNELGTADHWLMVLGANTFIGIVGLWRLHNKTIVDE